MTRKPIPLFINPAAGRGRAGRRLARIVERLAARGIAADVRASASQGDIERSVGELPAGSRILVAGGDGSIHEAVNGIVRSGGDVSLGVIPTGTGNDFAKSAGIPRDWAAACDGLAAKLLDDSAPRAVDLGRMNDRYFANGAGIGLDAKVTRIAHSYLLPVGDLVYLIAILDTMREDVATPHMTITGDTVWSGPVTLVSISNGPWIGGLFHIAPMADNRDGLLEMLIAAPVTRRRIFSLVPKLMRGRHLNEAEICHASIRQLTLVAKAPVESHLDGEIQPPASQFEFEVLPGALKLF